MTTFPRPVRRLAIAGAFALAVTAAPAIAVISASPSTAPPPVAQCMPGEMPHPDTGMCVANPAPNTPAAVPGNPEVPEYNGIPCIGHHAPECVGLEESQAGSNPPVP